MEVIYIYNPQNEAMSPHDVEVEELFNQVTVPIPNLENTRAINLESFKMAIDMMMNKAYHFGEMAGFSQAESVVHRVLDER